jgi:ABC-type uncharacterized transport system substrate-binding protein
MQIDYRFSAPDPERFEQMAKALIASKPDVIFAQTTPAALALQRETPTAAPSFARVVPPSTFCKVFGAM